MHSLIWRRPASTDVLDESAQMVGIPSGLSLQVQGGRNFFFVSLQPTGSAADMRDVPFEDVTLGPQLGRGITPSPPSRGTIHKAFVHPHVQ
jgi:hypothetical protein